MRNRKSTLNAFTLLALAGLVPACKQGAAERAGETIDEAVDDTGDALEDAGDAVEDAVDGEK